MKKLIRFTFAAVIGLPFGMAADSSVAQPKHSCSEMEEFLLTAKPVSGFRDVATGVTNTHKVTLENGAVQHDAHWQTVDEHKTMFQGQNGTTEMNFKDSYKYNIAAYELSKLLGLNMVPPYVERSLGGTRGSLSWWVENMMMESDRYKKKMQPPDQENWNQQMYAVRVFHELIYDTDPNLTNLLITKDWQLWIIDATRAFRLYDKIREPKNLVKIDRRLLERMRQLDEATLKEKLNRWLTGSEIHALNGRRVKIVQFFDKQIKAQGEAAVLYDFPRSEQACGAGL